ncbi:YfmQ family protein [Cytobacillus gottheilii]|uniref:YfmQ family protein n=1 Tax=Cytobacillus gottheilii TaxID=859144 RepID=UPI0009B99160|nr:YfmQ family protein [Cytobacillus gottheilii]
MLKFATNPPSAIVAWVLRKFELQPKLSPKDVNVTYNGKLLEEREKLEFIDGFNKATFLNKYFFITGTEKVLLHSETNITPFVIQTKRGKDELKFNLYCYNEHIDVVKQYKKKVIPYRVSSNNLQTFSIQNNDYKNIL